MRGDRRDSRDSNARRQGVAKGRADDNHFRNASDKSVKRAGHSTLGPCIKTLRPRRRGVDPARLLLKLEGETGRYRMTLVEHLRTPYWRENLWPRLARVSQRP